MLIGVGPAIGSKEGPGHTGINRLIQPEASEQQCYGVVGATVYSSI